MNGVVESMKIVTQENSERVAKFAFNYARKNGRKKVTIIHKANIMLVKFHRIVFNIQFIVKYFIYSLILIKIYKQNLILKALREFY